MAGDLAVGFLTLRRVAEDQRPDRKHRGRNTAEVADRFGIVVAGDPDPVAAALQRAQHRAIVLRHTLRTAVVVEAVAERDHKPRRVTRDQRAKPRQA